MRTRQLEKMQPEEILSEQKNRSLVYLPIGPLEWHGPHNPLGLDALHARAVAEGLAEKTGGVIMPTLYLGTERERNPETLKNIGFENTKQYILGMDYPGTTLPSQYAREETVALTVREYLRMLQKQGFRMIVIVNGHAADGQLNVLDRLAAEFSGETPCRVKHLVCFKVLEKYQVDLGHATKLETSLMMAIEPEDVDISRLPSKDEMPRIPNTAYGMTDARTFAGNPTEDYTIFYDPRDASPDIGEAHIQAAVSYYAEEILREYEALPHT